MGRTQLVHQAKLHLIVNRRDCRWFALLTSNTLKYELYWLMLDGSIWCWTWGTAKRMFWKQCPLLVRCKFPLPGFGVHQDEATAKIIGHSTWEDTRRSLADTFDRSLAFRRGQEDFGLTDRRKARGFWIVSPSARGWSQRWARTRSRHWGKESPSGRWAGDWCRSWDWGKKMPS